MGITREQGVSTVLLLYLYDLHVVHASTILPYPKVHVSSMHALCIHYIVTMQLTCFLISSI